MKTLFAKISGLVLLITVTTGSLRAGDINQDLLAAVKKGNLKEVQRLVNLGYLYVAKNYSGEAALLYCARLGDINTMERLLKSGCDIDCREKEGPDKGWTALMIALEQNHPDIASMLINKGAKLSLHAKHKAYYGWRPIHFACDKGNVNVVRLLLEKGAKVDVREKTKRMTPLMMASRKGNAALVKLLIQKGANMSQKDKAGWTPLIYAAESGSLDTVKALVDAGADVNAMDKDCLTVLQHAAARTTQLRRNTAEAPAGFEKLVPYLKEHGARMIPTS